MRQRLLRLALSTALVGSFVGATAGTALASSGSPGDDEIVITITDSHAGGSYDQVFEKAYANTTTSGTPVYIYVPDGRRRRPDGGQRQPPVRSQHWRRVHAVRRQRRRTST